MKTHYKIAVIDDWSGIARDCADWSILEPSCEINFYSDNITNLQQNIQRLQSYDIIVCNRNRTSLNKLLLSQLPNLKLIASTGPGNAVVDVTYANTLGITVCMTDHPGYGNLKNAPIPTAQLVWSYILQYYRKIHIISNNLKKYKSSWYPVGLSNQPESLSGKTLGIIGLGNIGSTVAKVGVTFGLNVIAWSFHLTQQRCDRVCDKITCCVTLEELMKISDIVVIAIKLGHTTKYLIDKHKLRLMKKTALLINVSRGDIIKEDDLVKVLNNNEIGGVGLDVFHAEPLPRNHPFRSYGDKVMISAHQGGFVKQAYELWYRNCVENIYLWMKGTQIRVVTAKSPIVQADADELKLASSIYERSKL